MRIAAVCGVLLVLASFPASIQAAKASPGGPLGPVTDLVILSVGEDPQHVGCDDFKPTRAHVLDFLQHSVVVTPAQTHEFSDGPCMARGTLKTRYGRWRWELRNMGTAWLWPLDDESRSLMLADPRQLIPEKL